MFVLGNDRKFIRAALLALLALAVVVQPIVGFASEIHESQHVESPVQAPHDSHGHPHDDPAEPEGPLDATDHWHVLMHFGHCCGHCAALMPALIGLHASTARTLSPSTDSACPGSAVSSLLLRPPIHG